jgi:thiol-disulfide isomerase/thioredoxin
MAPSVAPPWQTTTWLNSDGPLGLEHFRGRVVLLHAFQMLCPGCVAHALPQAQRVAELFADKPLAVVGLHTVFEHHDAMGLASLRAFVHEYRIRYPVGVDMPSADGQPLPRTMLAYDMQGTPTTVLIDAQGRRRLQIFGVHDDLLLGAEIAALLGEIGGAAG